MKKGIFCALLLATVTGWVGCTKTLDQLQPLISDTKTLDQLQPLINELNNVSSSYDRERAAKELGKFGPNAQRAVPALITALSDKDSDVRKNAADALGKIGPNAKESIPTLIKLLLCDEYECKKIYSKAAIALRAIDPNNKDSALALDKLIEENKPAVNKLIKGFKASDSRDWYAVSRLADIGWAAKDATPTLVEALKDNDPMVRKYTVIALGIIGPDAKDAVPALIEALKDKDYLVRREVIESLRCIGPNARMAVSALKEEGSFDAIEAINEINLTYLPAEVEVTEIHSWVIIVGILGVIASFSIAIFIGIRLWGIAFPICRVSVEPGTSVSAHGKFKKKGENELHKELSENQIVKRFWGWKSDISVEVRAVAVSWDVTTYDNVTYQDGIEVARWPGGCTFDIQYTASVIVVVSTNAKPGFYLSRGRAGTVCVRVRPRKEGWTQEEVQEIEHATIDLQQHPRYLSVRQAITETHRAIIESIGHISLGTERGNYMAELIRDVLLGRIEVSSFGTEISRGSPVADGDIEILLTQIKNLKTHSTYNSNREKMVEDTETRSKVDELFATYRLNGVPASKARKAFEEHLLEEYILGRPIFDPLTNTIKREPVRREP